MVALDRAIYDKAKRLVDAGEVTIEDETAKAIYLAVAGTKEAHKVRIMRDHTIACTCPFATLKGLKKGALCSHAVAAILHVCLEERG
ncbi:MAG: SWIM zinc finger family protein [Candidatus Thermoplasmatota archaeon]|nr:SWIM zinc finger family protein [Candidatus Thermoplasmatota archaeon]